MPADPKEIESAAGDVIATAALLAETLRQHAAAHARLVALGGTPPAPAPAPARGFAPPVWLAAFAKPLGLVLLGFVGFIAGALKTPGPDQPPRAAAAPVQAPAAPEAAPEATPGPESNPAPRPHRGPSRPTAGEPGVLVVPSVGAPPPTRRTDP